MKKETTMKILILDDDKGRLNTFRQNLIGQDVTCVETVTDTIKNLTDSVWDYLFLDHDLGGQIYVPSGPGTGYEVAEWLVQHPDKQPTMIVLHSFNTPGRQKMKSLLPKAIDCPGAWDKIVLK